MFTRLAFIVVCAVAMLGCAKARTEGGTDGATHFLMECERDADCGELSCVCGVCSTPCERDAQCSALSAAATCESAMSCEVTELACTIACDDDDACSSLGSGARCEADRCVRGAVMANDAGQGGSSGSAGTSAGSSGSGGTVAGTGGSSGSGGVSGTGMAGTTGGSAGQGPIDPACEAMDAHTNMSPCVSLAGFAWNGARCEEIVCGCEGSDCDAMYPTRAACERDFAQCATPCSRMQAESKNLDCLAVNGYTWTGTECQPIVCGCDGPDCDRLYESIDDCEAMHRACEPLTKCTRPTDCTLVDEQCCRCAIPDNDLVSIAATEQQSHSDRVCEPLQECPECEAVVSYYTPTCFPSTRWEGGECGKTHLDYLACTEEVGCRVRASECCECGASTAIENLFAMPNDRDAEQLFCAEGEACCEGEPSYPDNVEARCEEQRCVLYVDGEPLYR